MITYSKISQSSFNQVEFNMLGDGTATVLIINLSKPPFNISFGGFLPSAATVTTRTPSITATATTALVNTSEVQITVTFSAPPSATVPIAPLIDFTYNSL
jgi:hypothetical protein